MSLNSQQMENAEARCLELVNDGAVHKEYSRHFANALNKYGAVELREIAENCQKGDWLRAGKYIENNSWVVSLRDRHRFGSFGGREIGTVFSRVVFGLVLDHWLSSHEDSCFAWDAPAPRKLQVGDTVRIKVSSSLGGNDRYKIGEHKKVSGWTTYHAKEVVIVGGNYYRPEDLELVTDAPVTSQQNPCSEITAPHHLDRAIAEQKAYYSSTTKETVMLKIETKTYVDGREIAKLSVDDLVVIIAQAEAEIDKLKKLASKPMKVLAKIDELEAGLAALVKIADAE